MTGAKQETDEEIGIAVVRRMRTSNVLKLPARMVGKDSCSDEQREQSKDACVLSDRRSRCHSQVRICVGGLGRPSTRLFLMVALAWALFAIAIIDSKHALAAPTNEPIEQPRQLGQPTSPGQPAQQMLSAGRNAAPLQAKQQFIHRRYMADETPPSAEELAAARGLEQMLLDQMVQEMRKSVPENEFVPVSQGERIFRQMLDQEYTRVISESGTVGVAGIVLEQMKGKR